MFSPFPAVCGDYPIESARGQALAEEEFGDEGDDGRDEGDHRRVSKKGEDHQDENNSAVAVHDGLVFVGKVAGEKSGEDFFAVEWVDWDEVEDSERDIQENDGVEKGGEDIGNWGEAQKQAKDGRQDQVAGRSGNRDDAGIASRVGKVVRVEDHRLTPAKVDQEQHEGAQGVEMSQGVQTKPALGTGGGIAQTVGEEGMRELVDSDGDD